MVSEVTKGCGIAYKRHKETEEGLAPNIERKKEKRAWCHWTPGKRDFQKKKNRLPLSDTPEYQVKLEWIR